jgi:hypothetical protein
MKRILCALSFIFISFFAQGQCTTNNATGCQCKTPGQTDCDLLPDIQIGHPPFYEYDIDFGVKEFSQFGNPDTADNGRLYVTVSTPNTGHGPLELYTVDTFVCNLDTFYNTAPSICPDGITYPRVFMNQRIYHKSGNTMTSWTRFAGTMTYHPGHNHMHVDNWGNYTLRTMDSLNPNPLQWPIIGAGTKLAFCVEDYGTCPNYPDHCLDSAGNSLNSSGNFPNYGLGGGNYSCSPTVQGISSGYVDIYWTTLEGMYLEIPPGLCNGDYYIVCEVDPNQNFLEEDETNNYYVAPYRVRKQDYNPATDETKISILNSQTILCQGESVTLLAQTNDPTATYLWSNGDQTAYTTVNTAGTYSAQVSNHCGTGPSQPVTVTVFNPPAAPVGVTATLLAASPFPVKWYDQPTGGAQVGSGNSFTTPFLNTSSFYYAEVEEAHAGASYTTGLPNNTIAGSGGYSNSNQSLIFDCYNRFILHAVTIYANSTINNMSVQLYDSSNTLLQSASVNLTAGANVVVLDFDVPPGKGHYLTRSSGSIYRNNPQSPVGFPFTVPNICSITGTTAGGNFYYFFYNWDIHLPDNGCTSQRTPVLAYVAQPNAIADVSVIRSLKVYPNPARENVFVSFNSEDDKVKVELTNTMGQTIIALENPLKDGRFEETFNIASLSKGVYFIHILSSGKNYYHQLVIE